MSPRAGGFVALIATALLALATVVPVANSWWSGHPDVEGFGELKTKDVYISLFTSKGCNTDGDGRCTTLALGDRFRAVRYSELAVIGLLFVGTGLLALTSLRRRSSRAAFAKLVMVAAAVSAIGSIVLLVMGTDIKADRQVVVRDMGTGPILFFIGTGLAIVSAVLGLMPASTRPSASSPAMRPSQLPSQMTAQQPHQSGGGFDVQALLADDALRPTADPMARPQSPGGALPGPAGPLIPPSGPQPLFQSAPQLRPLYEVNGAGFTPPAPQSVQFPARGPTPMPHAAVSAALGFDVTEPAKPSPVPPAPPPPAAPKLPPPTRTKAMSAAPPIPARRPPPPATRPPPPSAPTKMSAVVPPPPPPRPLTEDPADLMQTADFEKAMATGDSTDASALPFDTSTAENSTSAFQQEERTDVGAAEEDLATEAREKIDATDQSAPAPRGSKTDVELLNRPSVSQTDVEVGPVPRASTTSVISSAAPPPRHTPSPVRAGTPAPEAKLPISTAPESLPPPKEAAVAAGPSPACPQCEAPMNWVEEHLRFFCKSCRMYF